MSGQRSGVDEPSGIGHEPSGARATFGRSVRLTVASIWLIVRASFRASPGLATLVLCVAIVEAVVPVALAWTVQQLVDGLTRPESGTVQFAIVAMGVVGACWVASQWLTMTTQTVLDEKTDHLLERELMRVVDSIPDLSAVESPQFQDWLQTVAQRPRHLVGSISTVIEAIALATRVGAAVVLLAFVAPALMPLPLLVLVPIAATMRVEREMSSMLDDIATDMRMARLLFEASTQPRSAAEVRLFGMTAALADRQELLLHRADRRQRQSRVRTLRIMTVGWSLFVGGVLALLWVARDVPGLRSSGVLFLLVVLAMQLVSQAEQAALTIRRISRLSSTIERFTWLRDFAADAASRHRGTKPGPAELQHGIVMRKVSFRHTSHGSDALRNIDLTLPAGKVVALAGPCGAGKSTLVKLLLGVYQPSSGEILVDGTPLAEYDLAGWRARTAAGFQDYCRFELVAGESIGVGDLPRRRDRTAAELALGQAASHDLLDRLRCGLETPLGRTMPDGSLPSEGSWQKVALGRAMMRTSPALRVLDEPTASLDAESEARLFTTYVANARAAAAASGCVTVLVSHRFATVRTADLIIALRDGEVAEVGTHDQLMSDRGWYAKMCALQAAGYE